MESATPTSPPSRLYRSSTDKVVAGVCGGLAAYFKLDPALVRLVFLVFALAGGASLAVYIILWIAVPIGDTTNAVPAHGGSEATAIVLIAVGGIWLLANIGVFRFVNWNVGWPILLIAFGALLLLRRA